MSVTECAGLRAEALACALWPKNQPNQPHACYTPRKNSHDLLLWACDWLSCISFFDNSLFIFAVSWSVTNSFSGVVWERHSITRYTTGLSDDHMCVQGLFFWSEKKKQTWMFEMLSRNNFVHWFKNKHTVNHIQQQHVFCQWSEELKGDIPTHTWFFSPISTTNFTSFHACKLSNYNQLPSYWYLNLLTVISKITYFGSCPKWSITGLQVYDFTW